MESSDLFYVSTGVLGLIFLLVVWSILEAAHGKLLLRNIILRNLILFSAAGVLYSLLCFELMYPQSDEDASLIGYLDDEFAKTALIDQLFQTGYALTVIAVLCPLLGNRFHLWACAIASIVVVVGYVVAGRFHWGGGFLNELGFYDFSGGMVIFGFAGAVGFPLLLVYKGSAEPSVQKRGWLITFVALASVFQLWQLMKLNSIGAGFQIDGRLAGVSVIAAMLTNFVLTRTFRSISIPHSLLAGIVSVSSGMDILPPAGMAVAGIGAGFLFEVSRALFKRFKIYDPADMVATVFLPGIFGTLIPVAFSSEVTIGGQVSGVIAISIVGAITGSVIALSLKAGIRNTE